MNRTRLLSSIVIVALMIMTSLSVMSASPVADEQPQKARISGYISHAPISISGNAGFLGSNDTTGISWGDGTASDPYIIQGWDINAGSSFGIMVAHSDKYFTIRSCHIWNGIGEGLDGINIYDARNGSIVDNNCTSNRMGITLSYASHCSVIDNDCSNNNESGIMLTYVAHNVSIINNRFNGNMQGIYLGQTHNNTLYNNSCSYNTKYGLKIEFGSYRNDVRNNDFSNNYNTGMYVFGNSNNNTLSSNTCSNNSQHGAFVFWSNDNHLINNTFANNNGGGVQAYDNGTSNRWNSSSGYGNFWSDWATDNVAPWGFVDSPYSIAGTAGAKDYYPQRELHLHSPIYISSDTQFALKAMVEGWSGDGSEGNPYIISGYDFDPSSMNGIQIKNTNAYFTISGVHVFSTSHAYKGISLINAANGRIENTVCADNLHGIYAASCGNLGLVNCNTSSNSGNGIYILNSIAPTISDCDAWYNGNHGIHLSSCPGMTMTSTDASSNGWDGIYARLCDNLATDGCNFDENGMYGMYLSGCTNSMVMGGGAGSGADSNVRSGIGLAVCDNVVIASMRSTDNGGYGIRYDTSTFITITSCTLTGNTYGPTYP